MSDFSRRQFLRGAAGTAVALPLLSMLGSRSARALPPAFPRRLIVLFNPHGTVRKGYQVTGGPTSLDVNGILAPLAPHKADLVFLKNVDMASADYGPGDTHQEGMGALLSGAGLLSDPAGSGGVRMDTHEPIGWGSSISVDQFIARKLGAATKFPSLELGVISDFNQVGGRIVYLDAAKPVAPTNDPGLVFDRLFKDLGADPLSVARVLAERKSVLDGVGRQFSRLKGQIGKDDADKLQAHLGAVRDIEKRLEAPGALLGGACVRPTRATVNAADVNGYPKLAQLQMDLMVMAMACDLTRVGSIMFSHAGGTPSAPWLGIDESHHQLSHAGDGDLGLQDKLIAVKRWHAEQFAYLLSALKKVPEGSGTMLDNTLIFWGSELAVGNSHSHKDMPFVLAGRAGGYLNTGRLLECAPGTPHNNLLVSICHAMGLTDVTSFGNPKYCSGRLEGLAA